MKLLRSIWRIVAYLAWCLSRRSVCAFRGHRDGLVFTIGDSFRHIRTARFVEPELSESPVSYAWRCGHCERLRGASVDEARKCYDQAKMVFEVSVY
jgi:hypothetical protein